MFQYNNIIYYYIHYYLIYIKVNHLILYLYHNDLVNLLYSILFIIFNYIIAKININHDFHLFLNYLKIIHFMNIIINYTMKNIFN